MTRAYRSPLREERARRTPQRVVEAATAVFLDRGWAAAARAAAAPRSSSRSSQA